MLSKFGEGATAMPPCDGAWRNPATGDLLREDVILVYSYVSAEKFESGIGRLREFLHRMGRDTGQGEVMCEINDRLYKIRSYDQP